MDIVIDTSALILNVIRLLNLLLEIHSLDLVLFPGKLAMPSRLCLNRAG